MNKRPPEWRKTPGGIAREWEEESSRHRALTPPEWNSSLGGTKPFGCQPREKKCQGSTGGGREGTETPPPPEKPRRAEPLAATRG